jgi:uroporphyrinogen-III synthase
MSATLEVKVTVRRLPLSRASVRALRDASHYDYVALTSKNARRLFIQTLRDLGAELPASSRIMRVGPRADLLKFPWRGKRVLFPRSALAPYDIVKRLRARGATVRPIALYTAHGVPLSPAQKKALLAGKIRQLYFRSPSGIDGFLRQFRGRDRKTVLSLPALCIGGTTAQAARKAGFGRVSIKNV